MSNYTKRRQTYAKSGNVIAMCVPWPDNYNPYYYPYKPKRLRRNYALWVFVDDKESLHAGYSCYRTRRELKEQANGYPMFMEMMMKLDEERERNESRSTESIE